jgi:hypothetical protein
MILLIGQLFPGCRNITKDSDGYILEGRMYFRDIEGGCWQLIDGNNRSYEIVGEDVAQIQIDGLIVKLIVRDQEHTASICMVGKIVELVEIIESTQRE